MNECFVNYQMALKLKEKGFMEKCFASYDKDGMFGLNYCQPSRIRAVSYDDCMQCNNSDSSLVDAPTIEQVLSWFRTNKKLHVEFTYVFSEIELWDFEVQSVGDYRKYWTNENYTSYNDAAFNAVSYILNELL